MQRNCALAADRAPPLYPQQTGQRGDQEEDGELDFHSDRRAYQAHQHGARLSRQKQSAKDHHITHGDGGRHTLRYG